MKPAAFGYVRAESLDEACAVLARDGAEARILAGGQSLGAMLNMRLATPATIVDINRLPDLDRSRVEGDVAITPALVRQADALADAALGRVVPLLAAVLPHVGHYQTRSRGTLAGSVAHADPSAEIPLALLTLGGAVELRSQPRGARIVPAADFFLGVLTTARAPDELVTALRWPVARPGDRFAFRELAQRAGDYALVAGALAARIEDGRLTRLRLGFGGCADRPQLLPDGARFEGAALTPALVDAIVEAASADILCRGDLHAPAAYRRQLVATLTRDLLEGVTELGAPCHG